MSLDVGEAMIGFDLQAFVSNSRVAGRWKLASALLLRGLT